MSPRALVCSAVVAVMMLLPSGGQGMGLGGNIAVSVSVNGGTGTSQGPVALNTPTTVQCSVVSDFVVDATAGATLTVGLGAATASGAMTCSGSPLNCTQAFQWTVPWDGVSTAPTSTTVSCSVAYTNLGIAQTATSPIVTVGLTGPAPKNPLVDVVTAPAGTVLVDSVNNVEAYAIDPGGRTPLTYQWSANVGTFAAPSSRATTWTAPSNAVVSPAQLSITVTNVDGIATTKTVSVGVTLSMFQAALGASTPKPMRTASTAAGDLFVVNGDGKLFMLTKRGDLRTAVALPSMATAVAGATDAIFVATAKHGIFKLDAATGRIIGRIPWPYSGAAAGLAWDSSRGLLWGANKGGSAVALTAAGQVAFPEITETGATTPPRPLSTVVDVAVDAANGLVWVAEAQQAYGYMVHAYAYGDGVMNYVRPSAPAASVQQVDGLVVGPGGKLYASDPLSGLVHVFMPDGSSLGSIGGGSELVLPRGITLMANGDLAVANFGRNRVDRFGTGAALPTCAGDTDCDGLPDDWELKYGLNPNDASDALADPDGDGLNNREEFALGTNPKNADTDGDGFSDRAEMLAGYDPLNPNDHRPALTASNLGTVPPGLVRLNAVSTNAANCSASWRQTSGAKVALRDADTFTPSFIARTAGTYRFEAVAVCGAGSSSPAVTEVQVANVSPLADAGRLVVTAPGRTVALNAGFSTDANGDVLTYAWDQLAGAPTTVASRGAALTVRPMQPGYYAYELTAADAGGQQGKTVVGVVVADASLPTAIVAAPVVTATAGGSVTLDASASVPSDATFSWQQLEGASVGAIAASATPSVTLPNAGRYVFEVIATKNGVSSPPAQVMVVAGAPTAAATAPATAAVNSAIRLDGSASAGAAAWAWRQVAGPAAGLAGADAAVATAVPFAAGVYVFELTVADASGAVSAPVTVRIDVAAAGKSLPVARAVAPATANAGDLVVLNGRTSTGAARYRWTQVRGPWVAIDGTSAAPVFTAPAAGTYGFELVVDDGTVRSAPASVMVNVQ